MGGSVRRAAWAVGTALVLAFFAAGGVYIWNGADAAGVSVEPPATVTDAQVQAASSARVNGTPGLPRVMLVGNSVAFDLAPGFAGTGRSTPLNAAVVACAFPPSVAASYRNAVTHQAFTDPPCHPSGEVRQRAAFRPNVVLWIVSDMPGSYRYRGRTVRACSEPYDSIYKDSLTREIARLKSGNGKVVITTEAYVRFTAAGDGVGALALPDRTVDCNNRLRRDVASRARVQIVDLFRFTCPDGTCPVRRDGVVLRPGGLHYSGAGGVLTAQWILDQLR